MSGTRFVQEPRGRQAVEPPASAAEPERCSGDCPSFRVNENGTVPFDATAGPGAETPDSLETSAWLAEFQQQHGRRPRILHIGNIANNAYRNAKLLNEMGVESDVICFDYYHVMGCPEWQDADFEGEIAQFRPNWSKVNLNGFRRPRWFAQGPLGACINYLVARRKQEPWRAWLRWRLLAVHNRTSKLWFLVPCRQRAAKLVGLFLPSVERGLKACVRMCLYRPFRPAIDVLALVLLLLLLFDYSGVARVPSGVLKGGTLLMAAAIGFLLARRLVRLFVPRQAGTRRESPPEDDYDFDRRVKELVGEFARRFPNRRDKLAPNDLEPFRYVAKQWRQLFAHYDFVVGYATDSLYALLAEKDAYIAYEHGTIRDIPFEPTAMGRRTALAYAMAGAVYMTNADSMEQAAALQPQAAKIVYGLHGFDERHLDQWLDAHPVRSSIHQRLGIPEEKVVFFAPARHHWTEGILKKGNDQVIRAIAEVARAHPGRFCVVFVEWGEEVDLSRELIRKLGVEQYVYWIAPVQKAALWDILRTSDCVIDQFALPCFGGCTFEPLAIGCCPVITWLDDEMIERFFGATIPLYNCRTWSEIAGALQRVILSPAERSEKARRGREWIDTWHSHHRVASTLLSACQISAASQG